MAQPNTVWTSAKLKAQTFGGLVNPDIMQQIWDISKIPLPVQDMAGTSQVKNSYTEWTIDKLGAVNISNAVVDGADAAGNQAVGGNRVGNQCQISVKELQVSQRARKSDTIGRGDEMAYQIMMRQQELRRDVDAICVTAQASVADDGDTVAGKAGALGSWIKTNFKIGATGAIGGYNTATGLTVAPTYGTGAAISFAAFKDLLQSIYQGGGNPSMAMSVPTVIRHMSEYMFASTAQIATLTSQSSQPAKAALVAQGSVNVFVSDFGVTVELMPNRLQQTQAGDALDATLFIIDPNYLELGFLEGYNAKPLGKLGLADKEQLSADWTLKPLNEAAHGAYFDILISAAMVA